MTSFAISLLSLLLSRSAGSEPSRRRRARAGRPRPWANRSLTWRSPTDRPQLEALENRCLLSVTINEFPLPASSTEPDYIRAGPDGNVWFTVNGQNALGRITPVGQITELPLGFTIDGDFVFGKDGNIWVGGGTHITEINTQGVHLRDYVLPSANGNSVIYPAVSADGSIWCTEFSASMIAQITPGGQITEFSIPFPAHEIITGPDGNLWFDGASQHAIGRITPTGNVTAFYNPDNGQANGAYRGLTFGPNGNLWMAPEATSGGNVIEEVNTAGQLVAMFSDPDSPYLLTPGPDGNIWFSEITWAYAADGGNHIGSITPQGSITEYPIPTLNSEPSDITKGPDGNIWFTEYAANQIGEVVLNQGATTSTSVASSLSAPLAGQAVTFTATVSNTSTAAAPTGSVEFYDGSTELGPGTPGSSSGNQATWTLTTSALSLGSHSITAVFTGCSSFAWSQGSMSVTVTPPASLSGIVWEDFNDDGQVDFGEEGISGVQITLTGTDDLGNSVNLPQTTDGDGAYVFLNLRPGSYYITETQPAGYQQGIDSIGTAGGSLSATDQFFVQLPAGINGFNYNFGEQFATTGPVQKGQTAPIGFWNNKNGQALIQALPVITNADGSVTSIANWLAATLPNMFGVNAGSNNLTGQSNAYVAALFQQDFLLKGVKLDAQVLATALSVFATNATLDSTAVATQYGFIVSGDGVGTASVNVGSNGDAFGVANNTTMTVMDLLLATDNQAMNGILYGGSVAKRNDANNVYSAVNQAGNIG
jgi:streptogramin lyase